MLLCFRVRGLIVVVLFIGGGLGWVVRSAHIQREAVAAIANSGGSYVDYDWEWSNGDVIQGGSPWAPGWLVDLIGIDYFGHVTDVTIFRPTDSAIAEVGRLTRLQRLVMFESSITSPGLTHLGGLTELTQLDLGTTAVTDAGLANLEGLRRLSELTIRSAYVTDTGLAHLRNLTKLSKLRLLRTQITDGGLAHLKGLTNLSFLDLGDAGVSDAGLVDLRKGIGSPLVRRPGRHSGHRRRTAASDGTAQPRQARPRRHVGHRRRVVTTQGIDQSFFPRPRPHTNHRCWDGAPSRLDQAQASRS